MEKLSEPMYRMLYVLAEAGGTHRPGMFKDFPHYINQMSALQRRELITYDTEEEPKKLTAKGWEYVAKRFGFVPPPGV